MSSTPSDQSLEDSAEQSSKHTPGPWQWNKDLREIEDTTEPAWKRARIAVVTGHGSEYEANARLIAAAPALLDAAQEVLQALLPDYPDTAHLCDVLAGAVALATGRQVCNCVDRHTCEGFRGLLVTRRED